MPMRILSWNCRGLGDLASHKRDWIRRQSKRNLDFVALQETKLGQGASSVLNKYIWPQSSGIWAEASGTSGGVSLHWDQKWNNSFISGHKGELNNWVGAVFNSPEGVMIIINVYAPNHTQERVHLWHEIHSWITATPHLTCAIIGDFNMVLSPSDKLGGLPIPLASRETSLLLALLEDFKLNDIKPPATEFFTWSNGRRGEQAIFQRLDRCYSSWQNLDSPCRESLNTLNHLSLSDHFPVIFEASSTPPLKTKPNQRFYFNNALLGEKDFLRDFTALWNETPRANTPHQVWWASSIRRINDWLKNKGKEEHRKKMAYKKDLEQQLASIRSTGWASETTGTWVEEEIAILARLKEMELQNLKQTRQKAQLHWIKEGDANSRFFHNTLKERARASRISSLKDPLLGHTKDPGEISARILSYYSKLVSSAGPSRHSQLDWEAILGCIQGKLQSGDIGPLNGPITKDELLVALQALPSGKSPGLDGWTTELFHKTWEVVGQDLANVANEAYAYKKLHGAISTGEIVLTPKKGDPESLDNWRPISVMNVSYKIITKALALRLQPFLASLISPEQAGFQKGKGTVDNIIMTKEALHHYGKQRKSGVLIKLDFHKAFDHIEWDFLLATLRKLGCGATFTQWIQCILRGGRACVKTLSGHTDFFSLSRSLRQGCPLSPLLFVIATEALLAYLRLARETGLIKGWTLDEENFEVLVLLYADDSLLFLEGREEFLTNLTDLLIIYGRVSGLKINWAKSQALHVGLQEEDKDSFKKAINCRWYDEKGTLNILGIPIGVRKPKAEDWKGPLQKLEARLGNWKSRWLSLAGRVVLIKSVGQALFIYQATVMLAPAKVTDQVEKLLRDFLWQGTGSPGSGYHLVNWRTACMPKPQGGLGFLTVKVHAQALQAKWICQHWVRGDTTCSSWISTLINRIQFAFPSQDCPLQIAIFKKGTPHHSESAWWKNTWKIWTQVRVGFEQGWSPHSGCDLWESLWRKSTAAPLGSTFPAQHLEAHRAGMVNIQQCIVGDWSINCGWRPPEALIEIFNLPASWIPFLEKEVLPHWPQDLSRAATIPGAVWKNTKNKEANTGLKANQMYQFLLEKTPPPRQAGRTPPRYKPSLWKDNWNSFAAPKMKAFFWLVLHNAILTRDNLKKKNWPGDTSCPLCLQLSESPSHLFWECGKVRPLWEGIFTLLDGNHKDSVSNTWSWQKLVRLKKIPGVPKKASDWIIHTTVWLVWVARNHVIFQNKKWDPGETLLSITKRVALEQKAGNYKDVTQDMSKKKETMGWLQHRINRTNVIQHCFHLLAAH